jgi:hypothetical protein
MSFPATLAELEQAGYKRGARTTCSGCFAPMEFWFTPGGNRIPMDPMEGPDSKAVSHFATCPKAAQFRKARRPPRPRRKP